MRRCAEEISMTKDTVDIEIRVRYAETDKMGVAYYANYFV